MGETVVGILISSILCFILHLSISYDVLVEHQLICFLILVLQGNAPEAIYPIINHLINFSALINVANLSLYVSHSIAVTAIHLFTSILTISRICSVRCEKGIATSARPSMLLELINIGGIQIFGLNVLLILLIGYVHMR